MPLKKIRGEGASPLGLGERNLVRRLPDRFLDTIATKSPLNDMSVGRRGAGPAMAALGDWPAPPRRRSAAKP